MIKKFIVIPLLLLFTLCGCGGEDKEFNAYYMSKQFVKEYLKNPSSAKFPMSTECSIVDLGNGRYRVRGYVDATNSFNASIRSNYDAVVINTEGEMWSLESLILDGIKMR